MRSRFRHTPFSWGLTLSSVCPQAPAQLAHEAENYRWLEAVNGAYFSFFQSMWGQSVAPHIKEEIEFRKIRDKAERVIGDFPVGPCEIVSENFKKAIEEFFIGLVEIHITGGLSARLPLHVWQTIFKVRAGALRGRYNNLLRCSKFFHGETVPRRWG